jgi:hypothetical protein
MATIDMWAKVLRVTDVRNDAAGEHDMGNLQPGTPLHLVEEYLKKGQKWYRADNLSSFVQTGYPETWVNGKDIALADPSVPPVPEPDDTPTLAEFITFRKVLRWLGAGLS